MTKHKECAASDLKVASKLLKRADRSKDGVEWLKETYERQTPGVRKALDKLIDDEYQAKHAGRSPLVGLKAAESDKPSVVKLLISAELPAETGLNLDQAPPGCEDAPEISQEQLFSTLDEAAMTNVRAQEMTEAELYSFARGFFAGKSGYSEPERRPVKIHIETPDGTHASFEI